MQQKSPDTELFTGKKSARQSVVDRDFGNERVRDVAKAEEKVVFYPNKRLFVPLEQVPKRDLGSSGLAVTGVGGNQMGGYTYVEPKSAENAECPEVKQNENVTLDSQTLAESYQNVTGLTREQNTAEFLSDEEFQQVFSVVKGENGKLMTMTEYGAIPVPDEVLNCVPEKILTKPTTEERDIIVLNRSTNIRYKEEKFVEPIYNFLEVPKQLEVEKIDTQEDVKIIEVPRFRYTPVVEEKVIEVLHGIRYVEVPVEVPCKYPPKIVPVPKVHKVERIIESIKPVAQEKIIEVPEYVKKKVPRVIVKEIPIVVPKYVEKIVEIPCGPGTPLGLPQDIPPDCDIKFSVFEDANEDSPYIAAHCQMSGRDPIEEDLKEYHYHGSDQKSLRKMLVDGDRTFVMKDLSKDLAEKIYNVPSSINNTKVLFEAVSDVLTVSKGDESASIDKSVDIRELLIQKLNRMSKEQ